jgi:translocator protein
MRKEAKMLPNLVLPIVAVMAMNVLVFGMHWDSTPANPVALLNPPGELVGAVWVGLFLLIGMARFYVQKSGHADAPKVARLIIYYMLFCLSYPLYTLGLKSEVIGIIGNAATLAVASYLIASVRRISATAAWCLSPVLPWLIYATATMLF